jgi:ABC-2 type transport system permease protein
MREALWTELLKARRSRLPWLTVAAFAVATAAGGLFMFILQDPERARSLGLLGTKAELAAGPADWPTYLALQAQIVALGGALIFGITTIWLFGREFSDHTAKDLLALPTRRTAIVAAKLLLGLAWALLLTFEVFLLGLVVGRVLDLPSWSSAGALDGLVRLLLTTAMTQALVAVLALAASVGRGYLAAVGVMFGIVFTSQIVAALGYGHLFPWSVTAVYSGLAGSERAPVGPIGFTLVAVVAVAGAVATGLWWQRADQSR